MPDVNLRCLKIGDPPMFRDIKPIIHDNSGSWIAIVIEHGMQSGQPSVAMIIDTPQGKVVMETSLLAFHAAARGLIAMAETQFGWEMPL